MKAKANLYGSGKLVSAVLMMALIFSTCKKGEDDPLISFKSRKARLEGKWKLQEGRVLIGTKMQGKDLDNYNNVLDRTSVTFTLTTGGSSTIYRAPYSLDLSISKNGTFEFTEVLRSAKLRATGTWAFNSGAGDLKKKAEVFFLITGAEGSSTGGVHFFNKSNTSFDYHIRELRNKKLVLETSSYVFLDANGEYQGLEAELTFTQ